MPSRYSNPDNPIADLLIKPNSRAPRVSLLARRGLIRCRRHVMRRGDRLDKIAAVTLGNANYWWIIAACSEIGFAPQVPAGIEIKVPLDLNEVITALGY